MDVCTPHRRRRATGRNMPSLAKIADYWAADGRAVATFPDVRRFALGLGEPFCFRCGWFAPIPDMFSERYATADPWTYASGWLERAHLAERFSGGSDTVDNLIPLCNICHRQMPELIADRADAIEWVNEWDPDSRNPFWQIATDSLWAGDNYRPFPGSGSLLVLRLRVDDYHRRALIDAKQHVATAA